MSKGMIVKKLINEETDDWETLNITEISKGDRIRTYLSKEDAASNKVYSDCIVEEKPFIDENGYIASLNVKPYKEYMEELKLRGGNKNGLQ